MSVPVVGRAGRFDRNHDPRLFPVGDGGREEAGEREGVGVGEGEGDRDGVGRGWCLVGFRIIFQIERRVGEGGGEGAGETVGEGWGVCNGVTAV